MSKIPIPSMIKDSVEGSIASMMRNLPQDSAMTPSRL